MRKRRSVTPEVAGSSPVAPVSRRESDRDSLRQIAALQAQARTTADGGLGQIAAGRDVAPHTATKNGDQRGDALTPGPQQDKRTGTVAGDPRGKAQMLAVATSNFRLDAPGHHPWFGARGRTGLT